MPAVTMVGKLSLPVSEAISKLKGGGEYVDADGVKTMGVRDEWFKLQRDAVGRGEPRLFGTKEHGRTDKAAAEQALVRILLQWLPTRAESSSEDMPASLSEALD
jgi:hypothetical protein